MFPEIDFNISFIISIGPVLENCGKVFSLTAKDAKIAKLSNTLSTSAWQSISNLHCNSIITRLFLFGISFIAFVFSLCPLLFFSWRALRLKRKEAKSQFLSGSINQSKIPNVPRETIYLPI
ncbi:MAG TPA: hypothetical protein VFD29_05625 [Gillisia sp.]|nr:hypothetical protein [Gillisia sp.]